MLASAAEHAGVDPLVLLATVIKESGCNPKAVGSSGELGLGQVHPKYWFKVLKKELIVDSKEDLLDAEKNLYATAYILASLQEYGMLGMLRRYNGSGPAARKYAAQQVALVTDLRQEFSQVEVAINTHR